MIKMTHQRMYTNRIEYRLVVRCWSDHCEAVNTGGKWGDRSEFRLFFRCICIREVLKMLEIYTNVANTLRLASDIWILKMLLTSLFSDVDSLWGWVDKDSISRLLNDAKGPSGFQVFDCSDSNCQIALKPIRADYLESSLYGSSRFAIFITV